MSARVVGRLSAAAICFALLTGQSCGDVSFSDIVTGRSARITVENTAPEVIFVVLHADDAYQAGNISSGGSSTIKTHIDGSYSVVVSGSGSQLGNYKASLDLLRTATHEAHNARQDLNQAAVDAAVERTRTAKQNLSSLFQPELTLASCTGSVAFPLDFIASPQPVGARATVSKSADGAWSATCPSTS